MNGSHDARKIALASAPARTIGCTASSDSRHSRQKAASSASGSPPPATNVRVMSAQQREARSRGQMSTTTGSPGRSGPEPELCPSAPAAPPATITSRGRSRPVPVRDRRHGLAHRLGR